MTPVARRPPPWGRRAITEMGGRSGPYLCAPDCMVVAMPLCTLDTARNASFRYVPHQLSELGGIDAVVGRLTAAELLQLVLSQCWCS